MSSKYEDLYLYLARRDSSAIRFIAKFQSRKQLAVRIDNLDAFNLPQGWADQIDQIIYDSRMLWEPWIQSVTSFDELKNSLKLRGYKGIPINSQCEFSPSAIRNHSINISNLPKKTTMLKRN